MDSATQTVPKRSTYVLSTYYTFNHNTLLINNTNNDIPVYTKLKCSADLNESYSAFLNAIFDSSIYAEALYLYPSDNPYMNEDVGFLVKYTDHAEAHKLNSVLWYLQIIPDHYIFKTDIIGVDKLMWEKLSTYNKHLTLNINKNFIQLCSMKKKDLYDLVKPKKKCFKWLFRLTVRKIDLIYELMCKRYLHDTKILLEQEN
jgi:hypothetical protein